MNVTELRQRITNSVGEDSGLNAKVKFDLGNNEVIFKTLMFFFDAIRYEIFINFFCITIIIYKSTFG